MSTANQRLTNDTGLDASGAAPHGQPSANGRDTSGRFVPGNTVALVHGRRSHQVQQGLLDDGPAPAELEAALVADLGGDAALSAMQKALLPRLTTQLVVARYLEAVLVGSGPLTAKGRQRAALSAYLPVTDRILRYLQALGLERRSRDVVTSPSEYLKRLEQEQQQQSGGNSHE
jgi:hypothetical protein